MNLICILRGHDWEEVRSVEEKYVVNNLLEERFREYALRKMDKRKAFLEGKIPPDHLDQELYQSVCLRCCEVKDGIKNYLGKCEADGYEEMKEKRRRARRKEKAKYLLKTCAKGKLL